MHHVYVSERNHDFTTKWNHVYASESEKKWMVGYQRELTHIAWLKSRFSYN